MGRKKLRASGKKVGSLLYWAPLQGSLRPVQEAVGTKGLLHRVFWFGRCFAFSYLY